MQDGQCSAEKAGADVLVFIEEKLLDPKLF